MIRLPSWPSLATTLTQEVGLLATRPIELPYLAGPVCQPKLTLHCYVKRVILSSSSFYL